MADFLVQDGQTYLFQGDSITDAGRRAAAAPFGTRYAKLLIDLATANCPDRQIAWINKGIGGNRVTDLFDRWTDDAIRFQPDWVSILVGINDLHSVLRGTEPNVPVDLFREKYDGILARLEAETDAQALLIDPFYISADTRGGRDRRPGAAHRPVLHQRRYPRRQLPRSGSGGDPGLHRSCAGVGGGARLPPYCHA
jgi:lysophospholipase L1-like esterase